jgi:dolichyl-phosphate-mannose-protein mannosyltransferase
MIPLLASITVAVVLGYLAASFFWPRGLSRATLWTFAWPMGAGLCSLIFFLFRRPMFTVEFALLLVLGAIWFWRRRPGPSHSGSSLAVPAVCLLVAGVAGCVVAALLFIVHQDPHGDWDAFAIWNSHARYLYRDGPAWQTHIQNTFHPDYPLLVPAMNARAWRYAGEEMPETGGWLGLLYTLSAIAVLTATLTEMRGLRRALIIGCVLLSTPFFLEYGVMQSADVPLSLYLLSAIALLCLYSERGDGESGLLVLSGFMAGCAGWTKNEGLIFVAALCVSILAPVFVRRSLTLRRFGAFAAGLVLPLAVVIFFKSNVGLPTDYAANRQSAEIVGKLVDPERHMTIIVGFAKTLWSFGEWVVNPLIPLLVFVGLSVGVGTAIRTFGWLTSACALVLVLAGYFGIYVIATYDLQYLLEASSQRLFLHLWPPFLLLAGLVAVQYEHAP